ncbi:MAG: dynamin family protein [Betaproteobacteria bacterium]|nr:dynamin family protein [Betaproteobacteria bacterium]
MSLAQRFAAYSQWRHKVIAVVERFRKWLVEQDLSDAQTELRLSRLKDRIREDKLNVAFVAEFSRGKSELINSIFFADYGDRILPSSAGRTTMCPTELMFIPAEAPAIRLLPIETRADNISVSEYKRQRNRWHEVALDTSSAEKMQQALRQVSEVVRATPDEASELGFINKDGEKETGLEIVLGEDGKMEIPRWRHAIINFPHPLLEQGLVILDTPGLNAIGSEPELTLSLLPNAHAVLFILAADTGVTQSDLIVWREHIGGGHKGRRGRMVVLNKIDGLWDELRSEAEIEAEIARQSRSCAEILELNKAQIFPVSAQKGLVAKVNQDYRLLLKSRLPQLENALSFELIPSKHEIVREDAEVEFGEVYTQVRNVLEGRLQGLAEQLTELGDLRGKNKGVVEYMMGKIKAEKEEFESGLQHYHAVRSVFSTLTNRLLKDLSVDSLRALIGRRKEKMLAAHFSRQISGVMESFFIDVEERLKKADKGVVEIQEMMRAVYKRLTVEQGLRFSAPVAFSVNAYAHELKRLHGWCNEHLNSAVQLLTSEKKNIVQRFFSEVAAQTQRIFERANWDAENWLKIIMAPMETQVREHQLYLKRRLESIRRIHQASETLEERIEELEGLRQDLEQQITEVDHIHETLQVLLKLENLLVEEHGKETAEKAAKMVREARKAGVVKAAVKTEVNEPARNPAKAAGNPAKNTLSLA